MSLFQLSFVERHDPQTLGSAQKPEVAKRRKTPIVICHSHFSSPLFPWGGNPLSKRPGPRRRGSHLDGCPWSTCGDQDCRVDSRVGTAAELTRFCRCSASRPGAGMDGCGVSIRRHELGVSCILRLTASWQVMAGAIGRPLPACTGPLMHVGVPVPRFSSGSARGRDPTTLNLGCLGGRAPSLNYRCEPGISLTHHGEGR